MFLVMHFFESLSGHIATKVGISSISHLSLMYFSQSSEFLILWKHLTATWAYISFVFNELRLNKARIYL